MLGVPAAVGAQSYPSSTSATFSDATPEAGQTIAISGNATPGATVSVTLTFESNRNLAVGDGGSATTLGTTTADASGAFSLNVVMPADLAAGNYVLAVMEGSTVLSSSAFEIATASAQGGSTGNQTPTQTSDDTDNAADADDAAAADTLPVTGSNAGYLGWGGAAFILGGGAAVVISRRRAEPESI